MNRIGEFVQSRLDQDREPVFETGEGPGRSLMLAFQAGDESAFDRMVLHYRSMVGRFIYRYVQDLERSEDLSQEVFLRIYKARRRYRPTAGFRTWLFTIAARLCLNDLRSRSRERRVIVPMPRVRDSGGPEEDLLERIADDGSEPAEEALERKELEEAIDEAIDGLPPGQRAAILLLRFEDLSYREIAQVLGISVMAVKSSINRARESLRSSLGRFFKGRLTP